MEKKAFQLCEHPWLALLAVMLASVCAIILSGMVFYGWVGWSDDSPAIQFLQGISYHSLVVFLIVPFLLHIPKGKRTFRQYLTDIGLTRMRPFVRLVLLALSSYVILALSQATGAFVYRLFEGQTIDGGFVAQVFDLSGDLPPQSQSVLLSIPSVFEEVVFRGIVLTCFLNRYSDRESIVYSAVGFGLMHLLNLLMGRELVWVLGQVVWAFMMGLFYGYVFVKTRSLLPVMIVHYLSNVFVGSLAAYMQSRASIEIQALYGVIFTFGIVPVTLMILWARFYLARWMKPLS